MNDLSRWRRRRRRDVIIGWAGAILFGIAFWAVLIWAIIRWVSTGNPLWGQGLP
jgi:hypothetical protein